MRQTLQITAVLLTLLSSVAPPRAWRSGHCQRNVWPNSRTEGSQPGACELLIEDVAGRPREWAIGESLFPWVTRYRCGTWLRAMPMCIAPRRIAAITIPLCLFFCGLTTSGDHHFNFGLHDLKYLDEKGTLVTLLTRASRVNPLPQYEHPPCFPSV